MSEPERSAALRRVLAAEDEGLPTDFAAQVAALAEAESAVQSRWALAAMCAAFAGMIGVCVAGWLSYVGTPLGGGDWLELAGRAIGSQPWLVIGVGGIAFVQLLTFARRARIQMTMVNPITPQM